MVETNGNNDVSDLNMINKSNLSDDNSGDIEIKGVGKSKSSKLFPSYSKSSKSLFPPIKGAAK